MEKQSDTKDTQGDSLQQKSPEKRSHSSAPVLRNNEHVLTPSKDHALSDKKKPIKASPFKKKDKLICMFCGGKGCKHENYLNNKNSVIKGLDSDWILNDVLAMQRPSTRLIREFNIIEQFKSHQISAVFNLQELGEHPLCGDGVIPSTGFSYSAEDFSDHGIFFYHFGWKDMTATDPETMLKIMDLIDFSLRDGKKSIRSQSIVTLEGEEPCLLKMSAKDAIALSKAKRKGVLKKSSQIKFLTNFEKYLNEHRKIFNEIKPISLHDIIRQQKKLASSEWRDKIRYCPLILAELYERIEILLKHNYATPLQAIISFFNVDDSVFKNKWDKDEDNLLQTYKNKLNNMTYDELSNIYDLRIYSNLLLDFFDGLSLPVVSFDTMKKVAEGLQKGTHASEFVSLMSKTEFQIIKLFSQLLSNCRQLESSASKYEEWYGIRVALSLLLLRKKYDKSFVKRTLLKLEDIDNENVKTLSKLIILLSKSSSEDLKTSYNSFYNIIKPKSIGPPAQDDSTLKTDASVSSANGDKLRASAEKAPSGNQEAPNKL